MSTNNAVIRVEGIGKCYRIGLKENAQENLSSAIFECLKSPFRNYQKFRSLARFKDTEIANGIPGTSNHKDIIWALKDVSFEVMQGEVLGIIGVNAAGKSTLLKILSRITDPTRGHAEIRGRVASLLEVGTGFHPELTGRENVYLNGTILGMSKKEIDNKFDEIVEFSEIEKFLDTPVKRYSSGMGVRLAFAVAAHLEPEILLVDEVLAVGDAHFQKKCVGKMSSVAKEGRTVLFVSHNMWAVTELCDRVIWLDNGVKRLDGPAADVVSEYMSSAATGSSSWTAGYIDSPVECLAQMKHARVISNDGDEPVSLVRFDDTVKIEIAYELKKSIRGFKSYLLLRDAGGHIIWASHDTDGNYEVDHIRKPGAYLSTCKLPKCLLRPGDYFVTVGIEGKPREEIQEEHADALLIQVSGEGYLFNADKRKGCITPYMQWDVTYQEAQEYSGKQVPISKI